MTLHVADSNGVRTLTLSRPERLNALTKGMLLDLHRALLDCSRDPGVRVVVLTGAGRAFCSGADLSNPDGPQDTIAERWSADPIWWSPEQLAARMQETTQIPVLLRRMSKPTIAAIRGPAVGLGFVLAIACDLRVASATTVLRTGFVTAGRCGDPGGSYLLSTLVGSGKARELYLLDPKLDAAQALAMGLVSAVVPDEQLESEVQTLAQRFVEGPALAYAGIKRNINAAATMSLEDTIAAEAPSNASVSMSYDGKEAARAFMEKRKPQFRGY